jgi:hypothetical protein
MPPDHPSPRLRLTARGAVHILLLLVAAVFLALHALHLNADFPNYSPWMDWSKYTDEGWYGDGAIRHFLLGHWYVPGDFNPAVVLPVWPFLEFLLFRFTGVSLVAARALTVAIFALTLISSYFLVRRWTNLSPATDSETTVPNPTPSLAPAIALLLLAVSPFCYAFTRLAILEPLLILLTLLALLTTSYIRPKQQGSAPHLIPGISYLAPVLLGLLIPLMVLTKTTAIFLLPAIAWLLWVRAGYRSRPFLRISLIPAVIAIAVWLTYYLALVRPRYLLDYHYLFNANAYTGITVDTALSVFSDTITDGVWMGSLIFSLAILATLIAVLNPRIARRNPLVTAFLFWAAGYTAFLAYHDNLQPRYYLVIAVPLTLLIPIVFESIWHARAQNPSRQTHPLAATALMVSLIITAASDARQTLHFVSTPEYTYATAANQIQQIITAYQRENPNHNPLVLSVSGSNLSLMTGLRSICDDFGTMQLNTRVATYRPGWFITWNQINDDKMDALSPYYHLQRVAEFPVMDDPDRNLLILYRLDPAASTTQPPSRRRRPIPKLLQTKLGQQPSVIQLQH